MMQKLDGLPNRWWIFGGSLAAGFVFITVLSFLLGEDSTLGVIFLDRAADSYPLTIQNILCLMFFIGLGEILLRGLVSSWEAAFLTQRLLPEDEATVLQAHDLAPIRRHVAASFDTDNGFLPSLIDLCILQFQASRSVDQTVSVLNSQLELIVHRVDLRYSVLRYIVWAIPTFGFIGTVLGISGALGLMAKEENQNDLTEVLENLSLAFNTTLVALVLSAILVFLMHLVERREEHCVNMAGHYCLKNLINRLYAGGPDR